jgi:2-C-methyl-D-erythritol 4-phosphate cytidylyltransferase
LERAGCSYVVAVVPPDLVDDPQVVIRDTVLVVAGGDTRQQSVANGLMQITADAVVVHDAVRPLVSPDVIRQVVGALEDADAAITAAPAAETVKKAEGRRVVETVDRSSLWLAQTPQAFRTGVLRAAHERAAAEGFQSTDDAQLVERSGGRVAIVESLHVNLKVTHPEDFAVAEALLSERRK